MSVLTDTTGRAFAGAVHALVHGQVADNKDPNDLGRVKVLFPSLAGSDASGSADDNRTSGWFRVVRPLAAQSGEFFNLPDIGDEVIVGFLDGDPEHGVVLGQLSSIGDKPHEDIYVPAKVKGMDDALTSGASDKRGEEFENHRKVWRSRLGHMIVMDDTPDAPMLQLFNPDKSIAIVFDEKLERLALINSSTDVTVEAKRDIILMAERDIVLGAKRDVFIQAEGKFDLLADGEGTVSAGGDLTVEGTNITLN